MSGGNLSGDRGITFPIDSNLLAETEKFLHAQIPLTQLMGVRVVSYEPAGLTLTAPVTQNSNHLGTAFGGSINAVATLAGYALLWLESRALGADLVVAESSIRFLRPIRETIIAHCDRPPEDQLAAFCRAIRSGRSARLSLRVSLSEDREPAAQFRASFVALQPPSLES